MTNHETGHKRELSDATSALADAITTADPAALRKAAGDHATALNSQATAMAASIAEPLYGRFDAVAAQIRQLAEIVTNARQADLTWRTEERSTRDAQADRLYTELDKLFIAAEDNGARLGKLGLDVGDLAARLITLEVRMDESQADRQSIHDEVAALRDELRVYIASNKRDEFARRIAALEARK